MTTASPKWSRTGGAMSLLGAMTFPGHPSGEASTTTTRGRTHDDDNYTWRGGRTATTTRTRKGMGITTTSWRELQRYSRERRRTSEMHARKNLATTGKNSCR
jgi:hypothetical protein